MAEKQSALGGGDAPDEAKKAASSGGDDGASGAATEAPPRRRASGARGVPKRRKPRGAGGGGGPDGDDAPAGAAVRRGRRGTTAASRRNSLDGGDSRGAPVAGEGGFRDNDAFTVDLAAWSKTEEGGDGSAAGRNLAAAAKRAARAAASLAAALRRCYARHPPCLGGAAAIVGGGPGSRSHHTRRPSAEGHASATKDSRRRSRGSTGANSRARSVAWSVGTGATSYFGDDFGPVSAAAELAALKRDAKRIHRSLIDAYRAVDLLLAFTRMNYQAVVKILKKHDKVTGRATQATYLALVDRSALATAEGTLRSMLRGIEREFVQLELELSADAVAAREAAEAAAREAAEAGGGWRARREHAAAALGAIFRALLPGFLLSAARGSAGDKVKRHVHSVRRRALAKLRPLPSQELDPRSLAVGAFLLGGCCVGADAVAWLVRRLALLPGAADHAAALVPVVRGPLLVLLHVALQGFVVAAWDASRVSHAFIFGGTAGVEMRYEDYILLAGIAGAAWLAAWAGILIRLAWRVEGAVAACGGVFAWATTAAGAAAAAAAATTASSSGAPPTGYTDPTAARLAGGGAAVSAEEAALLVRLLGGTAGVATTAVPAAAAAAGADQQHQQHEVLFFASGGPASWSYGSAHGVGPLHFLGGAWSLAHPSAAGVNCSEVALSAAAAAGGGDSRTGLGPQHPASSSAPDLALRLDEASGRAALSGGAGAAASEALLPAILLAVLVAAALAPVPEGSPSSSPLLHRAASACWPRRASRGFFFRAFAAMLAAPLASVRLPDFFLADQLVSQPLAIADLLYTGCFYASGAHREASGAAKSGVCLDAAAPGHLAAPAALGACLAPYWIRILQSLRRLADEGHPKVHLTNVGKYLLGAAAACLRLLAAHPIAHAAGAYRTAALAVSSAATAYGLLWDLRMDWGLGLPGFGWLRRELLLARPGGAQRSSITQQRLPDASRSVACCAPQFFCCLRHCFLHACSAATAPATTHPRCPPLALLPRSLLRSDRPQRRRPLPVAPAPAPRLLPPRQRRGAAHRRRGGGDREKGAVELFPGRERTGCVAPWVPHLGALPFTLMSAGRKVISSLLPLSSPSQLRTRGHSERTRPWPSRAWSATTTATAAAGAETRRRAAMATAAARPRERMQRGKAARTLMMGRAAAAAAKRRRSGSMRRG